MSLDIETLQDRLDEFAAERDWDQFHSPKNLAMAVAGEAGELVAEFQWLTEAESEAAALEPDQRRAIEDEVSDVLFYLLRLCSRLDISLERATARKLSENERRYAVETAKGTSTKAPPTL